MSSRRVHTLYFTNTHSSHVQYRDVQDCRTEAECHKNPIPSLLSASTVLPVMYGAEATSRAKNFYFYLPCAASTTCEPSRFQPTSLWPH